MADRSFKHHPSVAEFAVSKRSYLEARPGVSYSHIAISTLVLDTRNAHEPRILLLQRAAGDDYDPNKWEPPGGSCDDEDESILHAAARELWEEAGLQATHIGGPVGTPFILPLDDGRILCWFYFAVDVRTDDAPPGGGAAAPFAVRLNDQEHQRFVWATEEQVRARKVDDVDLDFTGEGVALTVLLAFPYFKEREI
ncbi:NUDIX hydrolase domain-like protein [Nemania sp. NC0429]|nr:NUDIX hydrolase domain-like protein [Nemania sp. NC0429]